MTAGSPEFSDAKLGNSHDPEKDGSDVMVHDKSVCALPPQKEDTLHRGLKSRQISMIAIGGAVGTGLIIGSGTALQRGGPLGMLLAYSIMGMICYLVMCALGEMASWIPHRKGFSGYATRYVDPALGIATGYNYLFKYLIVTPNNVTVASIVIGYWPGGKSVPIAAWISIFIVAILLVNFLGIKVFGEVEFWLSLIKVITLIGLLIMSICLTAGANPAGETIGFRYWKGTSGPFSHYKVGGSKGAFLGVWACFVNALFAYMGTELIGVTVGEASNPRKNIPSAISKTFWRILVFYVGGVFCISLLISSDDPELFVANKASASAAASPFVVAVQQLGVQVLPSIINAAILIFTLSAANSDLYIASRTLFALAEEGHAPRIFTKVNRWGCPYYSLGITWLFCGLAYLRVSSDGATVFGYFVNLVSLFGGLTWISIAYCHIRFVAAFKAQGIDRTNMPYKAPFGVAGSWVALVVTSVVCVFKGWDSFVTSFNLSTFMTNYIGFVSFAGIYLYYKIRHRTKQIPSTEVDLFTDKAEIDEDEAYWKARAAARGPLNWWERIVDKFV